MENLSIYMEIFTQKLPRSQIEIEIKLSSEEFDSFIKRATLNLGKDLEVEGFRKGKAPKEIIEREIGQEKILKEASELAAKESYIKAVLESGFVPLGRREVEILSPHQSPQPGGGLTFRAKTQVLSEINLSDYKKIASTCKREKALVKEGEVEDALKWLQKSRAKLTFKSFPCRKGDFVEIEFYAPQVEGGIKKEDGFILGEGQLIPGFEENLEGMRAGEEKEFFLAFPQDHFQKNLVGRKVDFKVKMKSVQNVELPELNDHFARNLGNFENLTALKVNIKQGIASEKEMVASQKVRQEILEKIIKDTSIDPPSILVEREKYQMMDGLKQSISQNLQIAFEDYLKRIKKSENELLDSFSSEAKRRVKNFLVLREISRQENIEVSDEEAKEEVNKALKRYPDMGAAKTQLDLDRFKEYIKAVIRNEKTLQFLESFSKT